MITQRRGAAWRRGGRRAVAIGLALATAIGAGHPVAAAPADACTAAHFDWAKKGVIGGGEFVEYHRVYATVTIQEPIDRTYKTETARPHDRVWYGNGALQLGQQGQSSEVLTNLVQGWSNDTQPDPFSKTPALQLQLTVARNGVVTVGPRLHGKNFLGRPPVTFQATCTDGLLTGVLTGAETGTKSITVSFTNVLEFGEPK